jgi:parallel beta-helix repeat protein
MTAALACLSTLLLLLAPPAAPGTGPVSVRDFGARGDGKTNDTAAFQKALALGRRTVTVPAGVYLLGPKPLIFAPHVRLTGDGSASVLRVAKGTGVLLQLGEGSEVSRLAVEGSAGGAGGSAEPGLVQLGREACFASVERVAFRTCRRVCIATANANDLTIRDCDFRDIQQAVSLSFSRRVRVLNNTVVNAKLHGLQFWGNWKWEMKDSEDLLFQGNLVKDGGGGGIWGAGARRVILSGNTVDGATDVGLDLEWCDDSVIAGNTVRNAVNGGISLFFACKGVAITSNTVRNDAAIDGAKAAWWVRSGIWLTYPNRETYKDDRGHRDVTIVGNTIVCADGDRHAIFIGSESDNIAIHGNVLRGGDSPVGGSVVEQPLLLRSRPENVLLGGPAGKP